MRVRKLVRLSREKAIRVNAHKGPQDGVPTTSDALMPVDLVPLNSVAPNPVPMNTVSRNPAPLNAVIPNPFYLNSVAPNPVPFSFVSSSSAPLNFASPTSSPLNSSSPNPVPLISASLNPVPLDSVAQDPVPLNAVGPSRVDEVPSCSTQDDVLPGLDELDKHFAEKIFDLLRKEETFSGQVKLMEWILQIQTPAVLNWYFATCYMYLTRCDFFSICI